MGPNAKLMRPAQVALLRLLHPWDAHDNLCILIQNCDYKTQVTLQNESLSETINLVYKYPF